jgi:hypothetical protein
LSWPNEVAADNADQTAVNDDHILFKAMLMQSAAYTVYAIWRGDLFKLAFASIPLLLFLNLVSRKTRPMHSDDQASTSSPTRSPALLAPPAPGSDRHVVLRRAWHK